MKIHGHGDWTCHVCGDAGWVWCDELPFDEEGDCGSDPTRYPCPYCDPKSRHYDGPGVCGNCAGVGQFPLLHETPGACKICNGSGK